jgi:tRNA A-37 threonylcarbamoyl transferase component Bud32
VSGEDDLEDLGLLGEGGWGEVRRMRDPLLGRDVAVKRLHARHSDNRGAVARFLAEARVTARLDHPSVVPVHALRRHPDGSWSFVMKEVRAPTLGDVLRRSASGDAEWPLRRVVEGLRRACEGVAFAHAQGVVHRDLKPANILLGEFGEAWVLDWGIAKVPGGGADAADTDLPEAPRTMVGSAIGTPGYMSPEHAGRGECTPRSDVWSLGAVLHEVLSGDVPTPGDTVEALLHSAREGVVARTRGPAELASVARRAMSRDPARRHADAGELGRELGLWLAGEPVPSHRYGVWSRLGRWLGAHARSVVGAGLVLVGAVGLTSLGAAGVAWQAWRAAVARDDAREALGHQLGEAAADARRRHLEPDATLLAHAAAGVGRDPRARGVLAMVGPDERVVHSSPADGKCRDAQWRDGAFACAQEFGGLLRVGPDGWRDLSARDEGLAHVSWNAGGGLRLEASRHTPTIRVFAGTELLATDPGHGRWTRAVSFVGDDVLSSGADGVVRRWDARTGEERARFVVGEPVERLLVGPDGEVAHWVDGAGRLHRLGLAAGEALPPLPGRVTGAVVVAQSPSGRRLAAGSWVDGVPGLRGWSLDGDGAVVEVPAVSSAVTALAWTSDDDLVVGDQDGVVWRCRLSALRCDGTRVDDQPVHAVAQGGGHLLSLGLFGRLRVLRTGPAPFERTAPGAVLGLSGSGSGWWVQERGRVLRFGADGQPLADGPGCGGPGVELGSWSACADGGRLSAAGDDGAALWSVPWASAVSRLLRTSDHVVVIGDQVVVVGRDGPPGRVVEGLLSAPGHDVAVVDGDLLAVATSGLDSDSVELVDLRTLGVVDQLALDGEVVSALALEPGGERPVVHVGTTSGTWLRWTGAGVERATVGRRVDALAVRADGVVVVARDGRELAGYPAFGAAPDWVAPVSSTVVRAAWGPEGGLLVATAAGELVALAPERRASAADAEARFGAALSREHAVVLSP